MLVVFSLTLFLSAFLLFAIQPMFGKAVLPLLGGAPAVWNTCMVFYQAALLAGYSYAHLLTHWLTVRRQAAVHLGLLILALVVLPSRIPSGWVPPVDTNPILWLLTLLLIVVGLPFFAVSAHAPLLQRWFANTGHPTAKDPYFLYAASNLGSLLALLSYPVLLEPHLRLADQSRAWTAGYGLLVILIAACAIVVCRSPSPAPAVPPRPLPAERLPWSRRIRWLMLSFVPSSLLLGLTTYLSTDIAAIPLLWVIPLSLYLLTFILVFSKQSLLPHTAMVWLMPVLILPLTVLLIARSTRPAWLLVPLHLFAFFVSAMVCHGELARDRPPAARLTEFYCWLSVGGLLGGLFNALIAPRIFDTVMEYPLAIAFACLLRPGTRTQESRRPSRALDYAMPLAIGLWVVAASLALRVIGPLSSAMKLLLLCLPPALLCYVSRYRSIRFGLGVAVFLLVGMFSNEDWTLFLHQERSFFGVYRVLYESISREAYHKLLHGTTLHGMQSMTPARRREPLSYYHPTGPLGQIFGAFAGATPTLRHVAVIGLGTGSTACYASPGQRWTFYEIDPLVKRLATDPHYFTYLRDCLETYEVILGDARLSLTRAPDHDYDLITVDAFSSDAIPVHLITREAMRLYLAKLAEHGLLAFHISNRYLRLQPVLGSLAHAEGLAGLDWLDAPLTTNEAAGGKTSSQWVVLARQGADLGALATDPRWHPVQGHPRSAVWTDDFSNILSVFRWQ